MILARGVIKIDACATRATRPVPPAGGALLPLPPPRIEVPGVRRPHLAGAGHFPLGVARGDFLAARLLPRLDPLAGAGVLVAEGEDLEGTGHARKATSGRARGANPPPALYLRYSGTFATRQSKRPLMYML